MRRDALIGSAVAAALLFAYLVGFATARREWFPYGQIKAIAKLVRAPFTEPVPQSPGPARSRTITTTFLRLRLDPLPIGVFEPGGALTSLGSELLLMTRTGEIVLVGSDGAAKSRVRVPDNGLAAYEAAARSEKYGNLQHRPDRLRYNDFLYYREKNSSGLVVSYTEWLDDEACYRSVVARLRLDPSVSSILDVQAEPQDWQIVWRTRPCLPLKSQARAIEGHLAGGRMAYRRGGKIVVSVGDYHWDGVYGPKVLAQSRDNDYGKMFEIDLDAGTARMISIGNRNPQGVLVDSRNRIWVTEHGPRGGDELNLIKENANYGWPEAKLGTRYDGLPWPGKGAYGRHDLYEPPVYAWVPSVGISALIGIDGFDPSWDGDFLAGSLTGSTLYRLRLRDDRVEFAEPIRIGLRIRDMHQHSDGLIYVWTDESVLLRVSAIESGLIAILLEERIAAAPYDDALRAKLGTAIHTCMECHSFDADAQGAAPSLGGVYGRQIGATDYADYSGALRTAGGAWTTENLAVFLSDPQRFAPGTFMPNPQLDDPALVDAVVALLESLATPSE